jgi:hypothetical protein
MLRSVLPRDLKSFNSIIELINDISDFIRGSISKRDAFTSVESPDGLGTNPSAVSEVIILGRPSIWSPKVPNCERNAGVSVTRRESAKLVPPDTPSPLGTLEYNPRDVSERLVHGIRVDKPKTLDSSSQRI